MCSGGERCDQVHDGAESGSGAASCSQLICGGELIPRSGWEKRKICEMLFSGENRSMEIKNSCKGKQMFYNRTYIRLH